MMGLVTLDETENRVSFFSNMANIVRPKKVGGEVQNYVFVR